MKMAVCSTVFAAMLLPSVVLAESIYGSQSCYGLYSRCSYICMKRNQGKCGCKALLASCSRTGMWVSRGGTFAVEHRSMNNMFH